MTNPRISIIIPVYNVEHLLKRCIESVLSQSYKNFEVICVEDCSTDNSLEILYECAELDSRIKIVRNKQNLGLSGSRNVGLSLAQGEYVWFIDSDDFILDEGCLEKAVNHLERPDSIDVLMFECEQVYENERLENEYSRIKLNKGFDYSKVQSGKKLFAELIENDDFVPCVWGIIYKRRLLMDNKLFFKNIIHEDTEHTPRVLYYAKKVKCINDRYYGYFRREGSISVSVNYAKRLAARLTVYRSLTELNRESDNESFSDALEKYNSNILKHICIDYSRWLINKERIPYTIPADEDLLEKILTEHITSSYGKWSQTIIENISKRFLFLYEFVPKDSRIILYGLGKMGTAYLKQIEATGYCKIEYISDKEVEKLCMHGYPVLYPDEITGLLNVDYYVIAVDNELISNELYREWISRGVPSEKIVSIYRRHSEFPLSDDKFLELQKENDIRPDKAFLCIAFQVKGGIGDCITALSLCRKISEYSDKIKMDIYTDVEGMDAVFGREHYVGVIFANGKVDVRKYDLFLSVRQLMHVIYWDESRIKSFSNELFEKLKKVHNLRVSSGFNDEKSYHDLAIIKCAELLNQNRYATLGDGNVWGIKDKDSRLELDEDYYKSFKRLDLNSYITINCSAGKIKKDTVQQQIKIWSKDNFSSFCKLFKEKYPNIEIIQLGDADSTIISGADRLLAGEKLGLVKYVLANSLLHVDGEGGITHMATQLGTKCVVLFGPTPVKYYGYDQNINIVSQKCNGCMGTTPDWYFECPLYKKPICMESIKPENVFGEVCTYLDGVL
ncbi:Glycosyltransferase involved in cell wall bisynthesis [Pseudobutyrivibrio sp. 49]|uniref:glycosyltransferase n=1 Tax=Pseudobutyrivibrio sp. 49 TaxID=1855344 RepID=UPI0008877ED2|nr:glycosyltransferase [Pseudobutyrivibrio sp. 49]SDH92205.1 Glycosyltransferase involved in cell wall bisynthesis [Pseudobutyrivibrio sp. 49]